MVAVLDAGMALGFPNADFFVTPSYVLGKIYVNNFVMILNSRMHITHGRNSMASPDASLAVLSNFNPTLTVEFAPRQGQTSSHYIMREQIALHAPPEVSLSGTLADSKATGSKDLEGHSGMYLISWAT